MTDKAGAIEEAAEKMMAIIGLVGNLQESLHFCMISVKQKC